MGCSNSTNDPEIRIISQKINQAIQAKSTLQYQISQLKFLQEAKKAYPDVKEVKEAQIQNLRLSKEIKDTENLLSFIKGNEMQNEDVKALEETYSKLKSMLDDRNEEIKTLEQDVENETKLLEDYQNNLAKLAEDSEVVKAQLDALMQSEKYLAIKSLEDQIENLESILHQKNEEIANEEFDEDSRGPKRALITKSHEQLIVEIKKKADLEETLKEVKIKAESQKDLYRGEELRAELNELEIEEQGLLKLIEETEERKRQLERNKEIEYKKGADFKDIDNLDSRFDSCISNLLSGAMRKN